MPIRNHNNTDVINIFWSSMFFLPSTEYSFAVNTTSNLLSSSIKQGPIKKVSSAPNGMIPSINATRLQQIPNNIVASVEKIKNIVNTTVNDIRNSQLGILSMTYVIHSQ